MVTGLLVLGGLACAGWLTLLIRLEREGRSSPHFVLAVLPAALMLFAVPVAAAVWNLIRGFQEIARSGHGGLAEIAPFCLAISQSLWRAGAALLVIEALRTYSWIVAVASGLLCAWNVVEGLGGVRALNQALR